MSIVIKFANSLRWKKHDLEKLVARVNELDLSGKEFTINDLAILGADGKRKYQYSSFMAGATIMALVNSGVVEKTGVETFPVEFEERHWTRGGKSFFDSDGNKVSEYNLEEGVAYTVKTVESGYYTEKFKTTGRRNKYLLKVTDMKEFDEIASQFVDGVFSEERKRAFN